MSDYRISGQGLLEFGLSSESVVDGIGLLTRGFVFSCFSPFVPPGVTAVSTAWSQSFGTSATVWVGVTGTLWGDC